MNENVPELVEIEQQLQELSAVRADIAPKKESLQQKIKDLRDKQAQATIDKILGKSKNGDYSKITEQIQTLEAEIMTYDDMYASIDAASQDLVRKRKLINLAVRERRYKQLPSRLDELAKRYMDIRREMGEVLAEYWPLAKEASNLRPSIQTDRNELGIGQQDCGDLQSWTKLNMSDAKTGINIEQLRGQRKW